MEREEFHLLPGRPYAVGYVRSLATALGLDPAEALARLQSAWPQEPALQAKPNLAFPRAATERHIPVNAIIGLSLSLCLAAYAFWYFDKSAEMGRPVLQPVAALEEVESTPAPFVEAATPTPGPLQPLGVTALVESLDAEVALDPAKLQAVREEAARIPLPEGPLPRPRPGTEAASLWAKTYRLPSSEPTAVQGVGALASLGLVGASSAPASGSAAGSVDGLPGSTTLAAYLPDVKLRGDLGPLRGGVQLAPAHPPVRRRLPPPPAIAVDRIAPTEAFAATPTAIALMEPIATDQTAPDQTATAAAGDAIAAPAVTGIAKRNGLEVQPRLGVASAETPVVLHAEQDCWIELFDANGGKVLQRLLRAGERLSVPERSGLSLTAGNAGGLRIFVGGVALPHIGQLGQVMRNISLAPTALLAER